jgi:hypothetical protein
MFSEECFFALKIFSFEPSVRERAGEHYAGRQYRRHVAEDAGGYEGAFYNISSFYPRRY